MEPLNLTLKKYKVNCWMQMDTAQGEKPVSSEAVYALVYCPRLEPATWVYVMLNNIPPHYHSLSFHHKKPVNKSKHVTS